MARKAPFSQQKDPQSRTHCKQVKNTEVYWGTLWECRYEDRKHQHAVLTITHDLNLKIAASKAATHDDAFFCFFFSFSSFSFSISATYFSISSGFKIYQRKFTISPSEVGRGARDSGQETKATAEGQGTGRAGGTSVRAPGTLSDPGPSMGACSLTRLRGPWKEPAPKAPEPARSPRTRDKSRVTLRGWSRLMTASSMFLPPD